MVVEDIPLIGPLALKKLSTMQYIILHIEPQKSPNAISEDLGISGGISSMGISSTTTPTPIGARSRGGGGGYSYPRNS